jgi:hypothetical protein
MLNELKLIQIDFAFVSPATMKLWKKRLKRGGVTSLGGIKSVGTTGAPMDKELIDFFVDNGIDYPGGNDHGSICKIKDQWYVFYHRMTNGTIFSRRGCVEKIEILPDGSIPTVEMTSLGFEDSLNPYDITLAETACVLKGNDDKILITEFDSFTRVITKIIDGCVMGWKYFDFGDDYSSKTMTLELKVIPRGCRSRVHVHIDSEDGEKIGVIDVGYGDRIARGEVKLVTGRHSLFFVVEEGHTGWAKDAFLHRELFDLEAFVFRK